MFLACQMPECQDGVVFQTSNEGDLPEHPCFWHTTCHMKLTSASGISAMQSAVPQRIQGVGTSSRRFQGLTSSQEIDSQGGCLCRVQKMRSAKFLIRSRRRTAQD